MSVSPELRAVPALDLRAQYASLRREIDEAIWRVVESQYFIMGPEVSALESEVALFCKAPRAIACASGSDALLLPLLAWEIGPGDEVITTPYSFFATASAIWRLGAKPVFVDIAPDDFNIDPTQIEAAITPRTRAIIPVHLYGQAAEMDAINTLARERGIHVLEDAAQAIGAEYRGRPVGTIGDAAAFSFYPSKNLGAYGDGGLMTTGDDRLATSLARLRVHGMEPRYYHHEVGINSRLDAIQAAVLRVKLKHLNEWTAARRAVAQRYRGLFEELRLTDWARLPVEQPDRLHVYNQFVIRVPEVDRDAMRAYLNERKIGTEIYYPVPLHLQACFATLNHKPGDFAESERAAQQTLALPIYPELGADSQRIVVEAIADYRNSTPSRYHAGVPKPHLRAGAIAGIPVGGR